MPGPTAGDVLDHVEEQEAQARRDQRAFQILHESGAADALECVGIAKAAELFARVSTYAQFEALHQIEEQKGCRFVRHGAQDRACRNIGEVCEALGFPKDKFYLLKQEVAAFSRHGAKMLEDGGVTRRVRRALLAAPADVKKQARALVAGSNGDKKALARNVVDLVNAFTAAERQARDAAEADARDAREKNAVATRLADRHKEQHEAADARLKEAQKSVADLHAKLQMLPFAPDPEVLDTLQAARSAAIANVGTFERAADALAARSAQGDQPAELNELALRTCELAVNLWGGAFGKYLAALDPDMHHTNFWAANALFTSPGARADIEQFEQAVTARPPKKGGRK